MVRPLIVANFSSVVGGGEIGLVDLARGLRALDVEPLIAIPGPGPLAEDLPRVIIPRWILGQAFGIRRLAATSDLIHVTGARGLVAAALAHTGKPIIWHVRVADSDPLDPVLEQLPDVIIANSIATTRRFRYARNVRVIYNGILPPAKSVARLIAPGERKRIAVIARMTPEKGHLDLIPSMLEILSTRPDIEFIFAGADQSEIGDRISSIGKEFPGRVVMLGDVPDISDHIHEFDLVVIPSRIEGFGRVAVESLMAGVTVAATRAGGLVEVLEGLDELFLPSDKSEWSAKLLALLERRPYEPERLAEAGRRFGMDAHVEQIKSLYLELLS